MDRPDEITAGPFDGLDVGAADEAFALLDALWESAPIGLAYFDTELRYRRVNGAAVDIDGGTADQRLGRTLEDVHGPVGATIAEGLAGVLADGRTRTDVPITGRLWHGRGPYQEWRMNFYPVRGADGAMIGVGVVLIDVTEAERNRRDLAEVAAQRQHALDRYQSLVEATTAAVWTRDADGAARQDAPGLRAITGQAVEEHLGHGFLAAVHPAHRGGLAAAWRAAVAAEPATLFTRDYRLRTADGGYRWFRTRAVPLSSAGRVVEWIGTETDIDDQRRYRDRLDVLAGATLAMNAALDPDAELVALAEAVVPLFADVCRVYVVDPEPLRRGPGGRLSGGRAVTRCAPRIPPPPSDERFSFPVEHPVTRCVRSAAPVLVEMPALPAPGLRWGAEQQWAERIGATAMLVAPVLVEDIVVAALLFIGCADRPPYTEDDLALVTELATRASAAVATATEFQLNRQVSLALQGAMLSEPPPFPGVRIEARYLPAASELQVGGDWYDAFPLPGGDLAVGVGDVAGHDLPAAVVMGQLRSMLRGLAHDSEAPPSVVLTRLDRVASGLDITRFTTLIYGRLARSGGVMRFHWSNAGHPPPLLIGPDGEPRLLTGVADIVLGVASEEERHEYVVDLAPGCTLLLYTDGLVEHRDDADDQASADLLHLARTGARLPLAELCDHLVSGSTADTGDDMVVLALRVEEP